MNINHYTAPLNLDMESSYNTMLVSKFAICEFRNNMLYLCMKAHNGMRPHDLVVLLKIISIDIMAGFPKALRWSAPSAGPLHRTLRSKTTG